MSIEDILSAHSKLQLHDANEAETRLKLIDRILFEILEWTHDDVSVEERTSEDGSTTYVDYIVRTAGSSFVIEAKRTGAAFSTVPNVRRSKLTGAIMQGALGDAITQAREYCRRKSIPFAVVTNGSQWIAFPGVRVDGVSFSESSAVVFPSLQSALDADYAEFSHLLSRGEVIAGSLETQLLGKSEDQTGERRLKNFHTNRVRGAARNTLYPLIEDAIVTAFTESIVESDPELLEKCYVQTPERIRFDRQIGMYIAKRQPAFNRAPIKPLNRKDTKSLKDAIEGSRTNARPVAMIVLGTVGAGKTTFLQYTRRVSSREYFEHSDDDGSTPLWIYIDFRDFQRSDSVADFIYTSVRDYASQNLFLSNFETCIRPAYRDELRALRDGPLKLLAGQEEKINERIADYLLQQIGQKTYIDKVLRFAATKAPIFLVIDNVDQFEDQNIQSEIFAEAMAFSHKNRLNLILSLREVTFRLHRSSPTFDAFDFAPLAIDAPAIPSVLSKRFFLAKQLLQGKRGRFIAENGAAVDVSDLSIVIDMLQKSVLGTNVGEVIDVLATSDVRLALRMTREFLESGYSDPGRAINTYRQTGTYTLPRHEALRSILLGNNAVYTEKLSSIGNPFDARLSRTTHQMLRLFVLSALVAMSSRPDFRYAEGAEIRNALRSIGFGDQAVETVLRDLCTFRFVFTSNHSEPDLGSSFYPSRLGGYLVRILIADPTFLEAVLMDTFISDPAAWAELRNLSDQIDAERGTVSRLKLRNRRVEIFFSHVHNCYTQTLEEARRRALSSEWCEDPFENIKHTLDENLRTAEASAIRNYGGTR